MYTQMPSTESQLTIPFPWAQTYTSMPQTLRHFLNDGQCCGRKYRRSRGRLFVGRIKGIWPTLRILQSLTLTIEVTPKMQLVRLERLRPLGSSADAAVLIGKRYSREPTVSV